MNQAGEIPLIFSELFQLKCAQGNPFMNAPKICSTFLDCEN